MANPQECAALMSKFAEQKSKLIELEVNVFMFSAADKGCLDVARQALEAGGSAIMRRRTGDTALHHAASSGEIEVAKLLIAHGGDINERDLHGATPLFLAAESNHPEMVKALLDLKADPAIPGGSDATPLTAAAFNGNAKIVDLLLSHGADGKTADKTGKSAVLYASARGFTGVVERLLASGVDVNAVYANNLTALMWAAGYAEDVPEEDGVKTVGLLLDKGAKLNEQDDRGQTALMTAAELGHTGVAELLIKRGADKTATSKAGKTAAGLAPNDAMKAILTAK